MGISAKEAFSRRLVEAMLERGHRSRGHAKSGVNVMPLARAANVTREMARRYTDGTAMPDLNKMQEIAKWLGVRLPWLRDGEGEQNVLRQDTPAYDPLSNEAHEVAIAWSKLSPNARDIMRNLIYMLALGEHRFPWMLRGRPQSETYAEWEGRQEQNFTALSQLRRDKAKG